MTFDDHLKKGLARAREARSVNAQIDAVLQRFAAEVRGDVPLDRQEGRRSDRPGVPTFDAGRRIVPSWSIRTDEFFLRGGTGPRELLCVVSRADSGFPVELAYADQTVWCESEADLEEALGEMLEHPRIATMLFPQQVAANG
ncbi:MAG: hypothetical protein MUC96_11735 [Myxococcaceae bacterium]|jgi:hypothetical protein|nr:hypothetical protein [Myxococcaceae bacterium]